jgi:hypothetical protein
VRKLIFYLLVFCINFQILVYRKEMDPYENMEKNGRIEIIKEINRQFDFFGSEQLDRTLKMLNKALNQTKSTYKMRRENIIKEINDNLDTFPPSRLILFLEMLLRSLSRKHETRKFFFVYKTEEIQSSL